MMDQHFHRRNPTGRPSRGGPQADDRLPAAQNDPRRRLSPARGDSPTLLPPIDRQQGDYIEFVLFDAEDVGSTIGESRHLVGALEALAATTS